MYRYSQHFVHVQRIYHNIHTNQRRSMAMQENVNCILLCIYNKTRVSDAEWMDAAMDIK